MGPFASPLPCATHGARVGRGQARSGLKPAGCCSFDEVCGKHRYPFACNTAADSVPRRQFYAFGPRRPNRWDEEISGHGVWHLLDALALYFVYLFYRQFGVLRFRVESRRIPRDPASPAAGQGFGGYRAR